MLTLRGSLRSGSSGSLILGSGASDTYQAAPNPQDEAAADPKDEALDAFAAEEYGVYQGHMANMLIMATLLFGFSATGTFLCVSFTGDETPMTTTHFINLVENTLQCTVAAVGVAMLVFVFSARAALQYQLYGATPALQPIYKGMLFITLAEVFLYYSLISFIASIDNYAMMNFVGPNICPSSPYKTNEVLDEDGQPTPIISSTSFCSRVGDSIYQEAVKLCGPVSAPVPTARDRNLTPQGPWILCQVYDTYTVDYAADGLWWFGWDREKNWADPGIFDPQQYPNLIWDDSTEELDELSEETFQANAASYDYWIQEAFLDVVTRTSDSMCYKNDATSAVTAHCVTTPDPALCLKARTLATQADACSGGKENDAVKCRKACQWTDNQGYWQSTKTIITNKMRDYTRWIRYILWTVLVCRAIAGSITTFKSLRNYAMQDTAGPCGMLWLFDCYGIFDTFQGHTKRILSNSAMPEGEE